MSKVNSIMTALGSLIGQNRKQRALVISLVIVIASILPFTVLAKPPPPPPPVTSVSDVSFQVNPNTITILGGQTATLLLNVQFSIPSGSAEQFTPLYVGGLFSGNATTFTVNWIFNGTVIMSTPSFLQGFQEEQTIGAAAASFTAQSFLVAAHSGPTVFRLDVTITNTTGSSVLFVKNSYEDILIAVS